MKLDHFGHSHPLVLVEEEIDWISIIYYCSACRERVEGSYYSCSECDFCLHKLCAELPREINYPFHLNHPLILYEKSQYTYGFVCDSCGEEKGANEFVYHCSSCSFDLDINCVLPSYLITGDFPKLEHFSHQHSLFFIQNHHVERRDRSCSACEELILGPFYGCFVCFFFLHKKCFDLPLKVKHPSHRKHSLTLLPNPPPHPEKCSCHLCTKAYKGFIYYCSLCEFAIMIEYILSTKVIEVESHEHPFTLVSRPITFTCDACGIDREKYSVPYTCTLCDLIVHKDCILLPSIIKLTRHKHPVSHIYFLEENEGKNKVCRFCWDEINVEYGSYHCLDCDYFLHVNCAMDKYWWEEDFGVKDESQKSNEAMEILSDEWASITCVLKKMSRGEGEIATEIKHFSHQHNLILSDEIKDDICCDGCIRPISTEFYYCTECDYSLHKHCAELPRKTRQWSLKTTLTLHYKHRFLCDWCYFFCSGFGYTIGREIMCIRCFEVPDYFTNQGHEHPLFYDRKYERNCSSCETRTGCFRCKDGDFSLCYSCVVFPHITWYKYDEHPLALTYHDDHVVDQCFCEICEKPRDANHWFYHCDICDYSVHPSCVLGGSPYVKLRLTSTYDFHPHPLTFVKEDFDYFECNYCGKRCKNVFFKCSESYCKFALHLDSCFSFFSRFTRRKDALKKMQEVA
ncbi:hypothetical protein SLE2022_138070 [Rubroshorea leprosula]